MDALAARVAEGLWEIGAVHVDLRRYYRLPHAQPSPLYVDTRLVCSHPYLRATVVASLAQRVQAAGPVDLVVGDETAGIPFAAWVAAELGCGMAYLRKQAKGHGLPNLLEGGAADGRSVCLVTDLVNAGATLLPGLAYLRQRAAAVRGVQAVVNRSPWRPYQPFAALGLPFQSLTDTQAILQAGLQRGALTPAEHVALTAWLQQAKADPVYAPLREHLPI